MKRPLTVKDCWVVEHLWFKYICQSIVWFNVIHNNFQCIIQGRHIGCRFCGMGVYSEIRCPASACNFANEPWSGAQLLNQKKERGMSHFYFPDLSCKFCLGNLISTAWIWTLHQITIVFHIVQLRLSKQRCFVAVKTWKPSAHFLDRERIEFVSCPLHFESTNKENHQKSWAVWK